MDDAARMRRQRKIIKKVLGPDIIPSYESSLEMGTLRLLSDLTSKDTTIEDALLKYAILLLLFTSPPQHLHQVYIESHALDPVRTRSHVTRRRIGPNHRGCCRSALEQDRCWDKSVGCRYPTVP